MRFLLPVGGVIDNRFGILTTPSHKGIPAGILAGIEWAADNEAFTKDFDLGVYSPWLDKMKPYRDTCLFVAVPDKVGDAVETLRLFEYWRAYFEGWPVAFVAQDGQEHLPFPDDFDTLFVGGSTEWKLSGGARDCIKRAQALGKRIHIGRVNYWARYNHFRNLEGSHEWTCDGTRQRFQGVARTVRAWAGYMDRGRRQLRLPLSPGNSGG
jgi:hypothetical protein